MDQPDLSTLSVKRAARLLGVSETWVRDLIQAGRLAAVKEGRVYAIPVEALQALLAEREVKAEAHRGRLHETMNYLAQRWPMSARTPDETCH